MPTYKYRCANDHEFETVHGMGDPPPSACEVCGAAPVTRVFYPISVSFTGSGFYATDYGQGGQEPKATAPTGDSAEASDKAAKSDPKSTKQSGPE